MQETLRFGEDFELDRRAYQLRRSGRVLKLERIPMELLLLLVEQPGQLVTREQIVEKVWGKEVFLDTDNSINGAIRKIRQALKDDPDRPRFIQTIPGRGYRFIAPMAEPGAEPVTVSPEPASAAGAAAIRRPFGKRPALLLATFVVLLVFLGVWIQWNRRTARPQAMRGKLVLAVLPLENLTGDPAQEYFSDGLTEELISRLGNFAPARLGVIARTSVMRYKDGRTPVDQVGRELGVQYVVEGSVRRDAGSVRIAVQLIRVSDQTHLWARQYDRQLSSLLAVQGEIAQAVADEIERTLAPGSPAASARPPGAGQAGRAVLLSPAEYEAYDLYLRGLYFWNKRTIPGFQQAIDYFQQAVAKDPGFARAYAGLADSYALISGYNLAPQREFIAQARAAAQKAMALDETLAEAHTSLAVIAQTYDWDWKTAEKEYRRAIELNPNYATARHWYAECLALEGRFDEALPEIERARRLDPLSLIIAADEGAILYFARQYDRAIQQFRAVLDMEENFPRAHMLAYAYVQKGRYTEALAAVERWQQIEDTAWTRALLVYVYGCSERHEEARVALARLKRSTRTQEMDAAPMIAAYVGLGDKEGAIAWLQQAYAQHSPSLTALKVDPLYDSLRSDPRFQELVRRVGLAH